MCFGFPCLGCKLSLDLWLTRPMLTCVLCDWTGFSIREITVVFNVSNDVLINNNAHILIPKTSLRGLTID